MIWAETTPPMSQIRQRPESRVLQVMRTLFEREEREEEAGVSASGRAGEDPRRENWNSVTVASTSRLDSQGWDESALANALLWVVGALWVAVSRVL